MINKDLSDLFPIFQNTMLSKQIDNVDKCSNEVEIKDLSKAQDLRLRKLSEYQTICKSLASQKLMIFIEMPNDNIVAKTEAKKLAVTLKEFSKYKITPVVIIEPNTKWGLVDFLEFNTGFYDAWIKTFFATLKSEGIKDDQMGIWVPFPEANIPTWNKAGSTPHDFALAVNKYVKIMRSEFPNTHASILLNSATYDVADYDWAYGEYISLLPFVKDIEPGLINSFGLQGLPWIPAKNSPSNSLTDPSQYLNYLQATEAAEKLGVKEIWFNTGTFGAKYTQDSTKLVIIDHLVRKTILDGVLSEAQKAQDRGFKVWINLFSENKSDTPETTDWSYWHNTKVLNTKEQSIFKDFIAELNQNKIGVSFYDSYPEPKTSPSPKM